MGNFFSDNEDLQFYLHKGIDWKPLARLVEHDFKAPDGFDNTDDAKQFYGEMLEMVGNFLADEVAPQAAKIDKLHLELKDGEVIFPEPLTAIFDKVKELELHGMCVPRELGGMNCPITLGQFVAEMFARADASMMTHFGFYSSVAIALLIYSMEEGSSEFDKEKNVISKTRFSDAIAEIMAGEAWGCMDITEPNAGSDMAALTCRAEQDQDQDGGWLVSGEKIFITSGHGKYHFVVARSEDAPGLEGLSLFMVPIYEKQSDGTIKRLATVERLEEKIGHHASATCTINFDRTPGFLVGKRGDGFKQMLLLMNGARVSVGFEAIGVCEAAYRLAKDYAAERKSMGKTIDRHELIADYLDEMRTDIQGLRALGFKAGYLDELGRRSGIALRYRAEPGTLWAKQLKRDSRRFGKQARFLTPLLKYLAAEKAVYMARQGIQIHGGVGYTTEYGAERLLRDALVLPIYEGTSQIQALMAMKDTLGSIIKNPQGFVRRVAQTRWQSLSARDSLERKVAKLKGLCLSAQQHLVSRMAARKLRALGNKPIGEWPQSFFKDWDPKRDFSFALLHAERLTRMLADVAVCEALLDQAKSHPERREVLERYLERATPRCNFMLDEITSTGARLVRELADEQESGDEGASAQSA